MDSPTPCRSCGYVDTEGKICWEYTFRKHLWSLNKLKSNYKGQAGRLYKGQRNVYITHMLRADIPKQGDEHRQVEITRIYRKGRRRYDFDNLAGGCKPLVDALRKHDIIHDDDGKRKYATVVYFQAPVAEYPDLDPDTDYVRVIVREL